MTFNTSVFLFLSSVACFAAQLQAQEDTARIDLELTLPNLQAQPYHKPFVAVWLETTEREPLETLAIWYDDAEWLKDLRQWWRRLGRSQYASGEFDGVSGATKKPGTHPIRWQGKIPSQKAFLNIEVVREEGGRSYYRQPIEFLHAADYVVSGSHELGETRVRIRVAGDESIKDL